MRKKKSMFEGRQRGIRKWFGFMENMNERRLKGRIYRAEVNEEPE